MTGETELPDLTPRLLAALDPDAALRHVVEAAGELLHAEFAALGLLDPSRTELERFIAVGVDHVTRHRIGRLPTGRGVLGELIRDPQPLRSLDVSKHPLAYGFPPGHPLMKTFLGVPVTHAGEPPIGNLYVSDKVDGQAFTDADEQNLVLLGRLAAEVIARPGHAQPRPAQQARAGRSALSQDLRR